MKKQMFLSTILSLLMMSETFAQTFQETFDGSNTEVGLCVKQCTDGGYIVAGYTASFGAGNTDVYLIRTNSLGDTLWTKTFGTPQPEMGYSVQQTFDGGFIITGIYGDFSGNTEDALLIKTDSIGNLQWTKAYGGMYNDEGMYGVQTSDSGFAICGNTSSFGAGSKDIYVIKTNSTGDALWTKSFGEMNNEIAYCIKQTNDEGFIITGFTDYYGAGYDDVLLLKLDVNGNFMWAKTFGGAYDDGGASVEQTSDGGYAITGDKSGSVSTDVYLIKTDSIGNLNWSKTYGGAGNEYGYSLNQTNDGGYIIAGYTFSFGAGSYDVYLIKTDSNGDTLWTKSYGASDGDRAYSVQQTNDGGYVISGYTFNFGIGYKIYLIKTDSSGNSGCNESPVATIVANAVTLTSVVPSTFVSGSGGIISAPVFAIASNGIVSLLCLATGINETSVDDSFSIFPNPAVGKFIIEFKNEIKSGSVQLFNILGKRIFEENIFMEGEKEINLKNISQGIYFVRVYDGEKYSYEKIIVEQD